MHGKFDADAFLNQTIFGLDTEAMLSDIEDFIEFSESNIEWQKQREYRKAEAECEGVELDDPQTTAQYRDQVLDGVLYRFEVLLTQRVRYAALTSIVTTIEWVLLALAKRASPPMPKKLDNVNECVHILNVFAQRGLGDLPGHISSLTQLTHLRNCVVHAAGLLSSYKYGAELRQAIRDMIGIKVSSINFLGEAVEIEKGYLQSVIEDARNWLPRLERAVSEQTSRDALSGRGLEI